MRVFYELQNCYLSLHLKERGTGREGGGGRKKTEKPDVRVTPEAVFDKLLSALINCNVLLPAVKKYHGEKSN